MAPAGKRTKRALTAVGDAMTKDEKAELAKEIVRELVDRCTDARGPAGALLDVYETRRSGDHGHDAELRDSCALAFKVFVTYRNTLPDGYVAAAREQAAAAERRAAESAQQAERWQRQALRDHEALQELRALHLEALEKVTAARAEGRRDGLARVRAGLDGIRSRGWHGDELVMLDRFDSVLALVDAPAAPKAAPTNDPESPDGSTHGGWEALYGPDTRTKAYHEARARAERLGLEAAPVDLTKARAAAHADGAREALGKLRRGRSLVDVDSYAARRLLAWADEPVAADYPDPEDFPMEAAPAEPEDDDLPEDTAVCDGCSLPKPIGRVGFGEDAVTCDECSDKLAAAAPLQGGPGSGLSLHDRLAERAEALRCYFDRPGMQPLYAFLISEVLPALAAPTAPRYVAHVDAGETGASAEDAGPGDTGDFWAAVDDVAGFVHEWADGCRGGDRARAAVNTLRDDAKWKVTTRPAASPLPKGGPTPREAALQESIRRSLESDPLAHPASEAAKKRAPTPEAP